MYLFKTKTILFCFFLLSTLSHAQGTQPLSLFQTFNGVDYIEDSTGQIPPPFDIVGTHQISPSTIIWVSMEGYVVFYDLTTKKIGKTIQTADYIITHSYYRQQTKQLFFCEKGKMLSVYSLQGENLHLDHKIVEYQDDELTINDFVVNSAGNQVVYERPDSTLAIWDLKDNQWQEKPPLYLGMGSFKLAYFNDSILFSGSNGGYLQRIDLQRNAVVQSKQLFNSTIFDFVFSANQKNIAVTDQEAIKILPIDLKSSVQITSNLALITHLQWTGEHQLLVAGLDNGIELWDFPTLYKKTLLYSENIDLERKKNTKSKAPEASGLSYLLLMEKDSIQARERVLAKTTALEINTNHKIAIAQEDLKISLYDLKGGDVNFLATANAYPHIAKWGDLIIRDLEFKTDTSIYFGATYSVAGLDLAKDKVFGFVINGGGLFDQIYKSNFEDIVLYKYNFDSSQRKTAKVIIERAITVEGKPSALNQKIRAKPGLTFRSMLNPSGFQISPTQKYLINYDSAGHVQLFRFEQLDFIYDDKLTTKPIRAIYFFTDEQFVVIDAAGGMTKYSIKDKLITEVEKIETNLEFEKVTYNGENTFAFYDQNRVHLFDLPSRKILSTWRNDQKGYTIETLQFFPKEQKYLVVLNEQGKPPKDIEPAELASEPTETSSNFYLQIATAGLLTPQGLWFLGDSTGQIRIYNFYPPKINPK